jgi:predicted dehydrogenase
MSDTQCYLVIGSGSIARRHIANLRLLFPTAEVACVSASGRPITCSETGATQIWPDLASAKNSSVSFAVIASPAPFHIAHATELLKMGVPVLIEKPLATSFELFKIGGEVLRANADRVEVAYNMRYLTSAVRMKRLLVEGLAGRLHTVLIDVGQYLPDWRPGTDYRNNVSARKDLGGGVLLELSHELDYLTWLFGDFASVFCVAGQSASLDIDVEDSVDAVLIRTDGLVANLHMDFLQRSATRTCKVIGEHGTIEWDLNRNKITWSTGDAAVDIIFDDPGYDRNNMYIQELLSFSKVAEGLARPFVDLAQGEKILLLVDALRLSSETHQVVTVRSSVQ